MKLIKNSWVAGILVIITILILLIVAIIAWPISDDSSIFAGSADSYRFTVEKSNTLFKAKSIGFFADAIDFHPAKNISIHYDKDTIIKKDDLLNIYVNYSGKRQQIIADAEVKISSDNATIYKNDMRNIFKYSGELNAEIGNTVDLALNNNTIRIYNGSVDSVMIGSETITDFMYIDFEMIDNAYSNVRFDADDIALNIYGISEFHSSGQLSKIRISRGEGILGIGDHDFDIKNNDILDIEIADVDFSRLSVNDRIMEFDGFVKSAKLNHKNIFINDPIYMLKFKPEQINAYATIVLAIITIVYVFFTGESIHQTDSTIEELRKERKMALITKRLEEFYYPLDELLKTYVSVTDKSEPELRINVALRNRRYRIEIKNYQDITNHQYLAEKDTKVSLDQFLNVISFKNRSKDEKYHDCYNTLVELIKKDISKLQKDFEILLNE